MAKFTKKYVRRIKKRRAKRLGMRKRTAKAVKRICKKVIASTSENKFVQSNLVGTIAGNGTIENVDISLTNPIAQGTGINQRVGNQVIAKRWWVRLSCISNITTVALHAFRVIIAKPKLNFTAVDVLAWLNSFMPGTDTTYQTFNAYLGNSDGPANIIYDTHLQYLGGQNSRDIARNYKFFLPRQKIQMAYAADTTPVDRLPRMYIYHFHPTELMSFYYHIGMVYEDP